MESPSLSSGSQNPIQGFLNQKAVVEQDYQKRSDDQIQTDKKVFCFSFKTLNQKREKKLQNKPHKYVSMEVGGQKGIANIFFE